MFDLGLFDLDTITRLAPSDLDCAIVGVEDGCAVYDYDRLVLAFVRSEGWSITDAREWVGFNVIGGPCPVVDEESRSPCDDERL